MRSPSGRSPSSRIRPSDESPSAIRSSSSRRLGARSSLLGDGGAASPRPDDRSESGRGWSVLASAGRSALGRSPAVPRASPCGEPSPRRPSPRRPRPEDCPPSRRPSRRPSSSRRLATGRSDEPRSTTGQSWKLRSSTPRLAPTSRGGRSRGDGSPSGRRSGRSVLRCPSGRRSNDSGGGEGARSRAAGGGGGGAAGRSGTASG